MFRSIYLKFTEVLDIKLDAPGVVIFVGPNNSGKSLVLREIEQAVISTGKLPDQKILSDFEIIWPTMEEVEKSIARFKDHTSGFPADEVLYGRFLPGSGSLETRRIHLSSLTSQLQQKTDKHWIASQFMRYSLLRLDGRTRFDLTNDQGAGDLLGPTANSLNHLFRDDQLRSEIRKIIHGAFGLSFVVDPTSLGHLRIRLSPTPPKGNEQSLDEAARDFHSKALHIKEASDGIQAYVGIITAVLCGEYRAVLIDEPEAFLHPPLARKLGSELTTTVEKRGGCLFASTHSADFLMGCVQASRAVRVVRLEYSNGKSKGKVVDPSALESILRSPLMRSANVVSALFHDGVVATESDNDRVFYGEVYHRISETEHGCPATLFVNAQNKQTVKDIVAPLRAFGIPAAAVVDIDVLKDGGATWTDWLRAVGIPPALHGGLSQQRSELKNRFDAAQKDMKKDGGVDALPGQDKAAADQLFDLLEEYGLFVVRKGELEHWLPALQARGKKTDWVVSALTKMGSDPTAGEYVRPAAGDVWDFERKIMNWIRNPARKGTQ
jgi:hypothetical protein